MEFQISRGQARAFPILVAIGLPAVTVAAQKTAKKAELPHAARKKIAGPRATLLFNGTCLYDDRELGPVTLNAARLGDAPTGSLQLQEHGMPVQFRNIWVVEAKQ